MDAHLANSLKHTGLYIYQCGSLYCESGHSYGPAIRDHFLIHYIHSGKGIFEVDNRTYHLEPGSGFLICPDVVTFYQADSKDPWHYSWIGFHGTNAEAYLRDAGLTMENPVFTYKNDNFIDDCFYQMAEAYYLKRGGEVKRLAYLYLFLSKLTELNPTGLYYDSSNEKRDAYITEALQYIEMNYSRKMTVQSISQHVGLNRSYLNSIFKNTLHISMQEYLIEFRIRKACELLVNSELPVGTISRSVGYSDPMLFSKMFKQLKGMAPTSYRKEQRLKQLNSSMFLEDL